MVKLVLDSYCLGYSDKHKLMPTLQWGRAGKVTQEMLSSGNDPRLVALVAYWWGRSPLQRQVDSGFSGYYFLIQHFDDMLKHLRDEGVNLDLDSPALPIARLLSDSAARQEAAG